ncbi:unnamed protein product [Mesocestoides corti]|uniref:Cyclin_C domain-containing protein n=1 Tax=Mesocestoides corti TaxID=53468 RepID=A0A0R3UAZ6_MESCO|nr:unnamed protein product [Mesocestoides corti]
MDVIASVIYMSEIRQHNRITISLEDMLTHCESMNSSASVIPSTCNLPWLIPLSPPPSSPRPTHASCAFTPPIRAVDCSLHSN